MRQSSKRSDISEQIRLKFGWTRNAWAGFRGAVAAEVIE
jgi:hypothetical protein